MTKRVFFDVTDLRDHLEKGHRVSGIQRVCLMVIDHMLRQAAPDDEIWLSFWDKRGRAYAAVQLPKDVDHSPGAPAWFGDRMGLSASGNNPLPSLEKYPLGSAKYRMHLTLRRINAALGKEAHFKRRGLTVADWRKLETQAKHKRISPHTVSDIARKGDWIVLLGAFWGNEAQVAALKDQRAAGRRVALMIHDLIPLLMPETVAYDHGLVFHEALLRSAEYTDLYLSNSACTARDLQHFLEAYGLTQPIAELPLAQDGIGPVSGARDGLSAAQKVNKTLYPQLVAAANVSYGVRALSKYPFVLCVGTWDTRKNLWRLAQAWRHLTEDPKINTPKLVLAGGPGWGSDDFEHFMDATGQLNGWIEKVSHPSDADLAYLYSRCMFSIMPSLYEGWGLPIGESLAYGKTSVVSDRSSMPEVGGDMVVYCDPERIESLCTAVTSLIASQDKRIALEAKIAQTRLRRWADVADDLQGILANA